LDADPTFGVFFMAKYEEEFKRKLVKRYLEGNCGVRTLAAEFGVSGYSIRQWVGLYNQHGDAGLQKKYSRYDAQFKLSVLLRMRQDDLSFNQTAALFGLRGGAGVVSAWDRLYHSGELDALEPKPKGRPKMTTPKQPTKPIESASDDTRTVDELRKENEYLRAEVAYLKKLKALVQAKKEAAQKKRG
jgi:transposase